MADAAVMLTNLTQNMDGPFLLDQLKRDLSANSPPSRSAITLGGWKV